MADTAKDGAARFLGEQAATVMRAWAQGPQWAWEGWRAASGVALAAGSLRAPFQWGGPALPGIDAWAGTAASVVWEAVRHLLGGQQSAFQLLRLSAEAAGASRCAAGARGTAAEASRERLESHGREELPEWLARLPSASAGSARDLARLGRLYMEEMARLSRPWLETLRPGPEHLRKAMAGDHSALIKFADLAWDACERTFGRLLESPSLGFTRELNERAVRAFAAWLDLRRTAFEYQVTLAGAFPRIWQELVRELGSRSASGKGVATLRELLGLWSETADRVLVEVFGSEEYARIQGRLLNAAMAYRIQEREAADSLLRMGHLPTRREVDEAGRMIHALRKELRRLERSLQGAERAVAPSQDDEAAPPPRARDGGLPPARSSRRGATRREGEAGPSPPGRSRKQGLPGEGAPAGARGGESSDAAPREKGGPPEGAEGR